MYDLENVINSNGLNLLEIESILSYFQDGLKSIYGENINLEQNSPDGQFTNIITQAIEDLQQVASFIFNSFNVNSSSGRILDRNVAFNGIKRQAGTFTQVAITITFNRTTTLQGLDDNYNDINATGFTVADSQGNNYILITSTIVEVEEGETKQENLFFRAEQKGKIEPILNTITNIITPQLGITEVNNNTAPIVIGEEEESDYNLLQRFKKTFSLGGIGGFNNIKASILNLKNVINVAGENNGTNETSEQGTPAHSVWIVVEGGEDDEIAEAIYKTLGAGCGMKGEQVINYVDIYGNNNSIYFDRPKTEEYYIRFKITAKKDGDIYDATTIKEYLVNNYVKQLGDNVNTTDIDMVLKNGNNNFVYNEIEVSKDNSDWQAIIEPTTYQDILTLNINNITIIE